MADALPPSPPNRPSRGSGPLTVHLADELDVYFNEVAHGRPVGFVASPKWKPRTDVYETDDELIVHMDIAGMQAEDFSVELDEGILRVAGERPTRQQGKRHYHAMEVQVGPFERRFRLPVLFGVVTSYGSPWWLTRIVMQDPGRKVLFRALKPMCGPGVRSFYLAHYDMDRSTPASRGAFIERVRARVAEV